MKFVDSCEVKIVAGSGGNGSVAFRREKFVPFGGPAGGDGGRGGNVIFTADPNLTTLLDVKYAHTVRAQDGQHGMGADCYGRGGEDITCRVPVGTQVYAHETNELIVDLDAPFASRVLAQGGRAGAATSTSPPPTTELPDDPSPAASVKRSTCGSSSK